MIRVIAGKFKGKKLLVPKSAKPITDRIKTSIFDLIKEYVEGVNVLDLFAGSGNFAIEALSRGAKKAVIVENDPEALGCIRTNLDKCNLKLQADVIKADALNYLKIPKATFDIIMLDPPFPIPVENKIRLLRLALKHLNNNGLLIFRYPAHENIKIKDSEGIIIYTKKYGISQVAFVTKATKA
ncbi:MAG TPA: 16S rRNA (guanine(966)-N(2))-methyltransferase RsmD [Candidatus Dojkabacteria bacterium]|nr:16S rRNA (guanine(966)-N(2))-methyltransferase RsmD [Candidatus Dojkabacteria bacterium]